MLTEHDLALAKAVEIALGMEAAQEGAEQLKSVPGEITVQRLRQSLEKATSTNSVYVGVVARETTGQTIVVLDQHLVLGVKE